MDNFIGKDKEGNNIDFSILHNGRIKYLEHKATVSRLRNSGDESYKKMKWNTAEGKTFDALVCIFGEERMLELNSSNFQELAIDFEKYGVSIRQFLEDLENTKNENLSDEDYINYLKKIIKNCKKLKIAIDNEKIPSKKTYGLIKRFEKILNLCDDIPQNLREKILNNILKNFKDYEYREINECDNVAATYYEILRKIVLNKDKSDVNIKYKNILHELIHAATLEINENGEIVRSGLTIYISSGVVGGGLNEGATEYFAQKLYSKLGRPEIPVIYRGEVNIIKGLVSMYGEITILNAMLNGTENLEKLMKDDGQDYNELRDLVDKYQVNRKNKLYKESEQIIEKIKCKRSLEKNSEKLIIGKNYSEDGHMDTYDKEEER